MPKFITKIKPYWSTLEGNSCRYFLGDALKVLSQLPSQSVHCVVTSPPYWGLRDYQVQGQLGSEECPDCLGWARATTPYNCGKCHVCKIVQVFQEVKRVLRDDGTLWLNYGDTYLPTKYLPSGNLVGIPWRVALALQRNGWILRQDIIWAKPDPMPESVKNRCTKAHEYLFLFAKRTYYYYDGEAIRVKDKSAEKLTDTKVPASESTSNKRSVWNIIKEPYFGAHYATFPRKLISPCILAGTSAKGCCATCGTPWQRVLSVPQGGSIGKSWHDHKKDKVRGWRIEGENSSGEDFYKSYIPRKTLYWQPGCTCKGKFVEGTCKVLASKPLAPGEDRSTANRDRSSRNNRNGISGRLDARNDTSALIEVDKTIAIYKSDLPLEDHPVQPCIVLDPFIGSGTTALVSISLGRNCWGIDLSEHYLINNAIPRLEDYLRSEPKHSHLVKSITPKVQKVTF